jgi:hypothetical protein
MQTLSLYLKCRALDKTISKLEKKLTAARAAHESIVRGFPTSGNLKKIETNVKRKYFMVIGINTAFSSRKRRDSVRATWMPQGALTWLHISLLPTLSKFKNLFYAISVSCHISSVMGSHGLSITR